MSVQAFCRVYKIVNDVDDKVYVGATFQTLAQRMTKHRLAANQGKTRRLYNHMRAIGIGHFDILLLETTAMPVTKEGLRAIEHTWIVQLDTVKNGLNERYEDPICGHGRRRVQCIECGGSAVCEHRRIRFQCMDCGGSQTCEHRRIRDKCADCNPCRFCGVADRPLHRQSKTHIRNFILG